MEVLSCVHTPGALNLFLSLSRFPRVQRIRHKASTAQNLMKSLTINSWSLPVDCTKAAYCWATFPSSMSPEVGSYQIHLFSPWSANHLKVPLSLDVAQSRNWQAARMESVTAAVTLGRKPAGRNINWGSVSTGNHKYEAIPSAEDEDSARELRYSTDLPDDHHVLVRDYSRQLQKRNKLKLIMMAITALSFVVIYFLATLYVEIYHRPLKTIPQFKIS